MKHIYKIYIGHKKLGHTGTYDILGQGHTDGVNPKNTSLQYSHRLMWNTEYYEYTLKMPVSSIGTKIYI